MLFLVECLYSVAGIFVIPELRFVFVLVEFGLLVPETGLEDID